SLERQRHQQALAEFDNDDLTRRTTNHSRFNDCHSPEAVAPIDNTVADVKACQPLLGGSRLHARSADPSHVRRITSKLDEGRLRARPLNQLTRTLLACGPFGPSSASNSTVAPQEGICCPRLGWR